MRTLSLALALLLPTTALGIEIPDPNLESLLRARLGVRDRELTATDMEDLVELRAFERDIEGLTCLEYAVNLEVAILECNAIVDIGPLLSAPDSVVRFILSENFVDPASPAVRLVVDEIRARGGWVDLRDQRTPPVASAPALAIALEPEPPGTLTISFVGERGVSYQLLFSDDLSGSLAVGAPLLGDGSPVEFALPLPAAPEGFFTVVAVPTP